MAVETGRRPTFIRSLSVLFYFSTVMGILPYSLRGFMRTQQLQRSLLANVFVVLMAAQLIVQYHLASIAFSTDDKKESGTLTVIIGYVIIYMEPLMLAVDVLGFVVYQALLVRLVAHMQRVDDQLARQHVHLDYGSLRPVTVWLLATVTLVELSICAYNFVLFQEVVLESVWWFITFMPLYLSSIAKIWFIMLMSNVRMKFAAINGHMGDMVAHYVAVRDRTEGRGERLKQAPSDALIAAKGIESQEVPVSAFPRAAHDNGFFLQHEIAGHRPAFRALRAQRQLDIFTVPQKSHDGIIHVQPAEPPMATALDHPIDAKPSTLPPSPAGGRIAFVAPADRQQLNQRLTALCQLHDEICDIGKGINRLFSFQMLVLMAYGFMSLTAKLYFVYCGMTNQNIPILFRSAESLPVSVTFIVYTGAKCVYVIYISWQTKLTAQKTGVMLHKVANVVDDNDCYVVVNHLSLKLLNHHLNFTACGFFDLDMTTLYAITGAITSYLIILIQFNLAAQRNKRPRDALNSTAIAMLANATETDRNAMLNV